MSYVCPDHLALWHVKCITIHLLNTVQSSGPYKILERQCEEQ